MCRVLGSMLGIQERTRQPRSLLMWNLRTNGQGKTQMKQITHGFKFYEGNDTLDGE